MKKICSRIEKIEKELAVNDNTQWLRLPDPNNPGKMIELKGCRTLVDVILVANGLRPKTPKNLK